jgi:hypothetical protein
VHTPDEHSPLPNDPNSVELRRDLFWQNVLRDSLMALAVAAGSSGGRLRPTVTGAMNSPDPVDEMFDGRVAVITTLGQRIPIADIYPVFACSSARSPIERQLSQDVQCTVFHIKTPGGEAYTLPISQITMIHALSDELVDRLQAAAVASGEDDEPETGEKPFGFGAFTQLSRQAMPPTPAATSAGSMPGAGASAGQAAPSTTGRPAPGW